MENPGGGAAADDNKAGDSSVADYGAFEAVLPTALGTLTESLRGLTAEYGSAVSDLRSLRQEMQEDTRARVQHSKELEQELTRYDQMIALYMKSVQDLRRNAEL
eukprot:TRINITY_DN4112_c0_g1_i2.p1 TRINITY_DN4112_c0_g1~~TRINITY_DN4112_c0_g1_i2.p1  ORF type:complete len:104 (-),score=35.66 TRINITY_DN4112_c0_g1_i2:48-359(-)